MGLTPGEIQCWNYVPPRPPKPKPREIPLPPTVYSMVHTDYHKDDYTNALLQYLLLHNHIIGWRPISEPAKLKLSDLHLDDGYITFFQPKVQAWRMVPLEPEICDLYTRKSLRNWVDHWRPKVENQYSQDYVYLTPSGKPFTPDYLRKFLNKYIKPVWPSFQPYNSRHWAAIARLIQSKVNNGSYDVFIVYDWIQHESIETTKGYLRDATRYYNMAPYDWVKAVLKRPTLGWVEENSSKSKNPVKTPVSNGTPPVKGYGPMGICTLFLLVISTEKLGLIWFFSFSLNPSFSFFGDVAC